MSVLRWRGPVRRAVTEVRTGRFERSLFAVTAAGAAITAAEIYLSHDGASSATRCGGRWWYLGVIMPGLPRCRDTG